MTATGNDNGNGQRNDKYNILRKRKCISSDDGSPPS
jgi:hypothetical protein